MACFRLAEPRDDRAITALTKETMQIELGELQFSRGPSFFASQRHIYPSSKTIVCDTDGTIVGMGVRSIVRARLFDVPTTVGYLGQLRSIEAGRKRTYLSRAFKAMREVVRNDETTLSISTILASNANARSVLESSGRAGMPAYRPITHLHTYLFRPRALYTFTKETGTYRQQFALSATDGDAYSWDQREFREISLTRPTARGRLIASLLLRSFSPLWCSEIPLHTAYLTNWSDTPVQFKIIGAAGLYALTLDERDARTRAARSQASYVTTSVLYGIEWEPNEALNRVIASPLPVYMDAGRL